MDQIIDYSRVAWLDQANTLTAALTINVASGTIQTWQISGVTQGQWNASGLGIGITPTAGNGLLQLASGTTKANGIAFGTDTFLYRNASSQLTLDGGTGISFTLTGSASSQMSFNGGAANLYFYTSPSDTKFGTFTSHSLKILTANTTAITIDTSQNATFAGSVTVDGATTKTIKYTNGTANGSVATTLGSVGPTGSTAGNPQGWMRINVGGTDRFVPYW